MIRRYHQNEIEELAALILKDGIISVPTDTVYGICGLMQSKQAQENLRKVKNRPKDKAFPIMCANIAQVESLCELSDASKRVMERFMPGPLTMVLKKKEDVPGFINGNLETIAIRLATSPFLEALIEKTGPLYMTSANPSGERPCETLDEIEQACPLLDGIVIGETEFGLASTIVDCVNGYKVLREGPISENELKEVWEENR